VLVPTDFMMMVKTMPNVQSVIVDVPHVIAYYAILAQESEHHQKILVYAQMDHMNQISSVMAIANVPILKLMKTTVHAQIVIINVQLVLMETIALHVI